MQQRDMIIACKNEVRASGRLPSFLMQLVCSRGGFRLLFRTPALIIVDHLDQRLMKEVASLRRLAKNHQSNLKIDHLDQLASVILRRFM